MEHWDVQKLTDECNLLKTKQFKLVIRELLAVHDAGYLVRENQCDQNHWRRPTQNDKWFWNKK